MGSAELIRPATTKDINILLAMSEEFFNASGYSELMSFDKDDTTKVLEDLILQGTLLTDGKSAMIGFLVYPMFFNKKHLVSQELFWWVSEEKRKTGIGVDILKEAERISKHLGAKTMMMLSLNDLNGERVNKLYERLGY